MIEELEKYGEISGFKINRDKTKMLVKNITIRNKKELKKVMGLQITKKIKYLGIWLIAKCSTIKEDNYTKLFNQIKKDLEKWGTLQLSLLGRIATIKMNVLPKILYLFQTTPIKLDKNFLENLIE
uniref:Reverse transcriptase domain-containing protein n=1 Tax=Micrurus surinamensis TaxID=129470 RepID=A0A2D4PM45_MICSU